MIVRKMSPVLKWAGGKTQMLDHISEKIPDTYGRYFEPFIGGAAVLLALAPSNAAINDTNEQLINLYCQLQSDADGVIAVVRELDNVACDKEKYYAVRDRYNKKILSHTLDAECAALMIWINKHCFNGLYRVNGKGLFNVPYNNRVSGASIDEDNLLAISEYLQDSDVTICCSDFEEVCKDVQAGDFVYFDSPYIPESVTASFTDYTKNGFLLEDHKRLAKLFRRLDAMGVQIMLSNNDVPLVYELYEGYSIQSIEAKRMINRKADKRTGREVLITNY